MDDADDCQLSRGRLSWSLVHTLRTIQLVDRQLLLCDDESAWAAPGGGDGFTKIGKPKASRLS